jgi:AraC-like DNA-binding protein
MNQPMVDNAALKAWRPVAEAAGADWAARAAALAADAETPLADFVGIVETLGGLSGDAWLGWRVGLDFDLTTIREVGDAIISARTLRGALQRFVDYFDILQDSAEVRLEIHGDEAAFCYRIVDPDIWPRAQDALFTLGIVAQIIRGAVAEAWSEVEVHLESCWPHEVSGVEAARALGARVRFDEETNSVRFPAGWLEAARCADNAGASLHLSHARFNRIIASRRRRMPATLRVRTLIFQDLNRIGLSQEGVARALGMSTRTLRRRLASEGESFQHLLDDCRMRLAAFEFRVRDPVSIAQTALRLGYSEHSTFTRAFARWSGMAPRNYLRAVRRNSEIGPGHHGHAAQR